MTPKNVDFFFDKKTYKSKGKHIKVDVLSLQLIGERSLLMRRGGWNEIDENEITGRSWAEEILSQVVDCRK